MKIILIVLCLLLGGCSAIDFINCGDGGYCQAGRQYGCRGSDKCLVIMKAQCLKENRTWNEEYGFCEYIKGVEK